MATQIINADQVQARLVSLTPTPLISTVLPAVSVGDVLSFIVRGNTESGQGLILLNGQKLEASLPPDVLVGERLSAQVTTLGDQLVLKLLDSQRPLNTQAGSAQPSPQLQQVVSQLETLLQKIEGFTPPAPQRVSEKVPLPLTDNTLRNLLRQAIQSEGTSSNLQIAAPGFEAGVARTVGVPDKSDQLLPGIKALIDARTSQLNTGRPEEIIPELKAYVAGGPPSAALSGLLSQIRRTADQLSLPPAERFITALREELSLLLADNLEEGESVSHRIERLIQTVAKELRETKQPVIPDKELLRNVLANLKRSQTYPEELKARTQESLAQLPAADKQTSLGRPVDSELAQQLRELAQTFEQVAARQDVLAQLNPIMQSIGEPALILFPFLLQGLFGQGEIAVHSRNEGKKKKKEESESKKRGNQSAFQRVQMSIPMPTMGKVDVDIAHRPGEILVRLMVEESDVGSFLLDELEHLATILRENGFEKAEIVAGVGTGSYTPPEWVIALQPHTSIVA